MRFCDKIRPMHLARSRSGAPVFGAASIACELEFGYIGLRENALLQLKLIRGKNNVKS